MFFFHRNQVVGVLLAIDIAIMTTWQITDPFYRFTKQMEPFVSIKLQKFICRMKCE